MADRFASAMYAFMKSIQIGSAATAPVSFAPSGFFSSSPTQTPTVMSGSNPMNHASVLSSTVPVLPASGHSMLDAASPVPRRTTPRSRLVMMNAVSARMTSTGSIRFFLEQVARAVGDRQNDNTASSRTPWFGKTRIGARHLEQRAVARAERDRQDTAGTRWENPKRLAYETTFVGPSSSIILIAGILRESSSARRSVTGPSNLWS